MTNPNDGDHSHQPGGHNHMNNNQNILPGQHDRAHYGPIRHAMYRNGADQSRMMSPTHMQQQQHMPLAQGGIPDRVGPVTRSSIRWHDTADPNLRKVMIQQIIRLLRAKKPQARQDWIDRLPDMAKKLEDKLFYQSTSEQDYSDNETLTRRLQNIALQITRDRKRQQQQQQQQQQRVIPGGRYPDRRASATALRSHAGTPTMYPPGQHNPSQRMHMPMERMHRPQQHGHAPSPMPPMNQDGQSAERNKNLVLKQQQHRLLLLRHASRCTYPPGTCPATKHCEAYKRLWVHIANCRNPQCETPHCVSSRYVLAHYHRCQEVNCPVCRPVREAIAKQNQMKMQQQQQSRGSRNPRMVQRPGLRNASTPSLPSPSPHSFNRAGTASPYSFQHNNQAPAQMPMRAPSAQSVRHNDTDRLPFPGPDPARSQSRLTHGTPSASSGPRTDIELRMAELERRRKEIAEKKRKEAAEEEAIQREWQQLKTLKNSGMSSQHMVSRNSSVQPSMSSYRRTPVNDFRPPIVDSNLHVAKRRAVSTHPALTRPVAQPVQQIRVDNNADKRERLISNLRSMQNQTSLVYTFGMKEIEEHVKSLSFKCASSCGIYIKPSELRVKAISLLKMLMDEEFSWIFNKPVDPVELGIPDYFDVIKKPMDLGTVKKNVESSFYKSLQDFANDVRLVFNNAMLYNPETGDVHGIARQYGFKFEKAYNTMIRDMKKEADLKRRNDNACMLCGGEKYTFEPPVYYCSGKCNQKIRRGAFFYITPDNKQFYCLTCYNSCLKDYVPLEDGSQISKGKLKKKKNDEVQEESWVECNFCKRWYHQVCVLFNARRNDQSKNEPFYCPLCVMRYIEQLKSDKIPQKHDVKVTAADLPRTGYSDFLEQRVKRRILQARMKFANNRNCPLYHVPDCGEITIRVVSCRDVDLIPRAGLSRLYADSHKYPRSFNHRVKCVLLFQKIDGVDVLILGLYTQVYGSDSPAPNTRTLYIAYLDSVNYFTPSFCRTPVYQEILSSTLEFEKKRGITKTFIWVCPPLAGDDYILYCHPKDQKTPKADMLRNWYFSLLEDCRKRGVIVSIDNLYDAYFQRMACVTSVPNFDGDYWPGVTEQFIEQLESDKIDPKSIAPRKKRTFSRSKQLEKNEKKRSKSKGKKQNKSKKKNKLKNKAKAKVSPILLPEILVKKEEESTEKEVDDENDDAKTEEAKELTHQSFIPPKPLHCLEMPQQDALTVKIGDVIQQMKEDFMVVYMHHICSSCNCDIDKPNQVYWLPELYDAAAIDLDYSKNKYAPPYALCDVCYRKKWVEEFPGTAPSYDSMSLEKVSLQEHELEDVQGFGTSNNESESDQMIKNAVKDLLSTLCAKVEVEESEHVLNEDIFLGGNTNIKEEGVLDIGKTPVSRPLKPPEGDAILQNFGVLSSPKAAQVNPEAGNKPPLAPPSPPPLANTKLNGTPPPGEDIITVLPEGENASRRSAWLEAPCSLLQMKPFKTQVPEKTLDTDAIAESQFFDTRQQFLSLCQGNKYQFDQLRRAKHSSMMVLYHLHNPHLPSFVHSCNNCKLNIAGNRFSCRECDDFDLCESCAHRSTHPHELTCANDPTNTVVIPAFQTHEIIGQQGRNGPNSQRRGYPPEYLRSQRGYQESTRPKLQAHMALLVHASSCSDLNCPNKHCKRMQQLLKHGANCKIRVQGSCKICQRIWGLLHLHSKQCSVKASCSVPGCNQLRAHMRRQHMQRQDRRIMMHTQRMQQERLQAQQMAAQPSPRGSETPGFTASSPSMDVQRGAKQGKHIR